MSIFRLPALLGRTRRMKMRGMIHALVFDLDGQEIKELRMVMQFMRKRYEYSKATFVVLSGHGLHLYYVWRNLLELR